MTIHDEMTGSSFPAWRGYDRRGEQSCNRALNETGLEEEFINLALSAVAQCDSELDFIGRKHEHLKDQQDGCHDVWSKLAASNSEFFHPNVDHDANTVNSKQLATPKSTFLADEINISFRSPPHGESSSGVAPMDCTEFGPPNDSQQMQEEILNDSLWLPDAQEEEPHFVNFASKLVPRTSRSSLFLPTPTRLLAMPQHSVGFHADQRRDASHPENNASLFPWPSLDDPCPQKPEKPPNLKMRPLPNGSEPPFFGCLDPASD